MFLIIMNYYGVYPLLVIRMFIWFSVFKYWLVSIVIDHFQSWNLPNLNPTHSAGKISREKVYEKFYDYSEENLSFRDENGSF